MEDIIRIREIMGLKTFLKEGLYGLTKMLLMESTPVGDYMNVLKSALKKNLQNLTEEEIEYLGKLVDEYNLRYGDEFGNLNFAGKIDNEIRTALKNVFDTQGDDMLSELLAGTARSIERSSVAKKGLEGVVTLDQAFQDILKNEKIVDTLMSSDGTLLGAYDMLVFFYQKGGVRNSTLPPELLIIIKDKLQGLAKELPDDNIVKNYMNDVIDQIDEVVEGEIKQFTEEEIQQIKNEIPNIKNSIDNPVDPVIIDVTDDWKIDLGSGEDIGTGIPPGTMREQAIEAVMRDMEKKCKVGFCKTMVAYWKKDNKRFNDMWSYIYQKLSTNIKPKAQSRFYAQAPQNLIDEYELILKEFGKKDTPFTPQDYISLGDEIYEKMRKSGELGVFGGVFTPLRDIGVFTSKDMMYRTLGYVTLGTDPFKGGWTFKGMWDRWWKMNLVWFPVVLIHNIIESGKGSDDPTETGLDQAINLIIETGEDVALLGFAPGPRIFLEGAMSYINKKAGGSKYVDYPTLVDFLNKRYGWTENQIYDNLINKNLVRTFRDSTPPYTQVSGATDIFAVANGKYEIINKTIIGGLIKPKVVFTPEGSLTPNVTTTKTAKIDKEARNEIKKIIGEESLISSSIKINLLKNKVIDFDKQESLEEAGTTYTILVYKATNVQDKKAEIKLNYDLWVAAGKPELKSQENWDKYVKITML